jgi:hypothetical protein
MSTSKDKHTLIQVRSCVLIFYQPTLVYQVLQQISLSIQAMTKHKLLDISHRRMSGGAEAAAFRSHHFDRIEI